MEWGSRLVQWGMDWDSNAMDGLGESSGVRRRVVYIPVKIRVRACGTLTVKLQTLKLTPTPNHEHRPQTLTPNS